MIDYFCNKSYLDPLFYKNLSREQFREFFQSSLLFQHSRLYVHTAVAGGSVVWCPDVLAHFLQLYHKISLMKIAWYVLHKREKYAFLVTLRPLESMDEGKGKLRS